MVIPGQFNAADTRRLWVDSSLSRSGRIGEGFRTPGSGVGGLSRTVGAGVRKPPKEETACGKGAGAAGAIYGDLGIAGCGLRGLEAKIN